MEEQTWSWRAIEGAERAEFFIGCKGYKSSIVQHENIASIWNSFKSDLKDFENYKNFIK